MAKMEEKKAILLIAAIGGTISLGAFAGVYFTYEEIDATELLIEQAKTSVQEADRKIAQIPKLEDDVIVLRENVDTYTRILPDSNEVNEFTRTLNAFAIQVGSTLEQFLPQKSTKSKGKYTNFSYKMKLKATTWQLLRFMSLIENHQRFMKISAVSLRASDGVISDASVGEGAVHDVDLTVETYVYSGKDSGKNIPIHNYALKRERLLDRIQSVADAVALERYDYTEQPGRRDIFVDPRPLVGGAGPGINPLFALREIDELEGMMGGLTDRFGRWEAETNYLQRERMRRELIAELDEVWSQARDMVADVSLEQHRSRLNSNVLIPVREMSAELKGIVEDEKSVSLELIEKLIADMKRDAASGEYQSAIERFDEVAPQLGFAENDVRREVAGQALRIREALQTTLDFEQIPLEITGQAVFAEGRRGLLINGTSVVESEMVTPEIMLASVREYEADFVFRDLLITKRW